MLVNGKPYRTIWLKENDSEVLCLIDQRELPHRFIIRELTGPDECITAIKDMWVRGAPLIGITAAYGMYLYALKAFKQHKTVEDVKEFSMRLKSARPTAVNLQWAVDYQLELLEESTDLGDLAGKMKVQADKMTEDDVNNSINIGKNGLTIIQELAEKKGGPLNIMTHCNAGWFATVDYGTATAPVYLAHRKGIPVHVWVSETRPRNQGFNITAFEMVHEKVPHTIIVDNAAGYLMQKGEIDLCIVGSDRTTGHGDVVNKIGTYLKALSAFHNKVPFYVAVPSSSIDWEVENPFTGIKIEERGEEEVKYMQGKFENGINKILIAPEESPSGNPAFDITPSQFVTGLITERGVADASLEGLSRLFPEKYK